jgi:hypothetical protein
MKVCGRRENLGRTYANAKFTDAEKVMLGTGPLAETGRTARSTFVHE